MLFSTMDLKKLVILVYQEIPTDWFEAKTPQEISDNVRKKYPDEYLSLMQAQVRFLLNFLEESNLVRTDSKKTLYSLNGDPLSEKELGDLAVKYACMMRKKR